jgi:hypothetical protein
MVSGKYCGEAKIHSTVAAAAPDLPIGHYYRLRLTFFENISSKCFEYSYILSDIYSNDFASPNPVLLTFYYFLIRPIKHYLSALDYVRQISTKQQSYFSYFTQTSIAPQLLLNYVKKTGYAGVRLLLTDTVIPVREHK